MKRFKMMPYKHFVPFKITHSPWIYKQTGWVVLSVSTAGRKQDAFSHTARHKRWFPHKPPSGAWMKRWIFLAAEKRIHNPITILGPY